MNNPTALVISAWLPGGGVSKVITNLIEDGKPFSKIKIIALSKSKRLNWDKNFNHLTYFHDIFYSTSPNPLQIIIGLIKSRRIIINSIKHEKPDYILVTHSFLLPLFFFIKGRVVFWPHNNLLNKSLLYSGKKVFYYLITKRVETILCVNEQINREASVLGFNKASLVYNPIGESLPNLFSYHPKLNKLIHIGFLDERKNTSLIIRALAQSYNTKLVLDIIGDGVLLEDLKKLVSDLKLIHRVNFLGMKDLSNSTLEVSCLIMASYSEGFSMIISDALKSGIPVILPRNLDVSSYVEQTNSGVIFNLKTPESLTKILDQLNFNSFNEKEISEKYIKSFGVDSYSEKVLSGLQVR